MLRALITGHHNLCSRDKGSLRQTRYWYLHIGASCYMADWTRVKTEGGPPPSCAGKWARDRRGPLPSLSRIIVLLTDTTLASLALSAASPLVHLGMVQKLLKSLGPGTLNYTQQGSTQQSLQGLGTLHVALPSLGSLLTLFSVVFFLFLFLRSNRRCYCRCCRRCCCRCYRCSTPRCSTNPHAQRRAAQRRADQPPAP